VVTSAEYSYITNELGSKKDAIKISKLRDFQCLPWNPVMANMEYPSGRRSILGECIGFGMPPRGATPEELDGYYMAVKSQPC
jgi:hypothetical protein